MILKNFKKNWIENQEIMWAGLFLMNGGYYRLYKK